MSRMKNFSRNLATNYLQLGVNVACALVSIPIILHWLPKAQFGLWMMLLQLMSYIALVDLGVNQAISRFLIDHKDHRGTGEYGALLKTSALVSVIQGLIVFTVASLGAPLLAAAMKILPEYQQLFVNLMRIQAAIAAFTFCMNPWGVMLNAHQRVDIVTWQTIFTSVATQVLLVVFLMKGCGAYAFAYANAITAVIGPCYLSWNCYRLGFLPRRGEWGVISWHQFKAVFLYGKDVFMMNLGAQLITTSQTVIVSRVAGLEAAAAWVVGSKLFILVRQIAFQPYTAAAPGLSEMVARKETERLLYRFRHLVVFTASLGVYLAVCFAMCNSLFVTIWTSGKISWSPFYDLLLAIWVIFTSLQVPHCGFVMLSKKIGAMRYLFFVEGCTFVISSLIVGKYWGLSGILMCSVACVIFFSYQFGLRRSSQYFHVSISKLALEWVRPSLLLAVVLSSSGAIIWLSTSGLPIFVRLLIHAISVGVGGGFLFLRLGLPAEVIRGSFSRLPQPAARLMGSLIGSKG